MAHVVNRSGAMVNDRNIAGFWNRVEMARGARRLAFPGCWEWTGGRDAGGYGRIQVQGERMETHRFIWTCEHGPIPRGLMVRHRCDNRRCVRPDHLLLGTARDNMEDMARRGRAKRNPSGEDNNNARLTDADVRAIRAQWKNADRRWGLQTVLAEEYSVSPSTISLIVRDVLRPLAR
jgi:hypothetical protein